MKQFISKSIAFLIPVIITAFGLDIFLSKTLQKSDKYQGEYEVWNDIYSGNATADLLIYGSSRAWVQIDPLILEDSLNLTAYNFGLDGHGFKLQYLRHREYLKYNKAPKQIILEIDAHSLQKREELYLYEQFLPYMLWDKEIFKATKSYKGYSTLDYYIPLIRYYGMAKTRQYILDVLFEKKHHAFRTKGYRGSNTKWTNNLDSAKKQMSAYEIKVDSSSVKLLNQFLNECQSQNIQVTFVSTPEYIEGQRFIKNKAEIEKLLHSIADKYKLKFLDYSHDLISYEKDFFYNAMHLNKTGAELFTKKLAYDFSQNQ